MEQLDQCAWCIEFTINEVGCSEWYFGPQNADGWYGVAMDGKSGVVTYVGYMTGGNG